MPVGGEMKNHWLDRSLLELDHYTLCTTEVQYRRTLKHLKVRSSDAPSFLVSPRANASAHHFVRDGKYAHVVCLGSTEGKDDDQVIALLIHEAVHLWQEFRRGIGEVSPGDEIEAYAIQSISQSLITEYRRQTE